MKLHFLLGAFLSSACLFTAGFSSQRGDETPNATFDEVQKPQEPAKKERPKHGIVSLFKKLEVGMTRPQVEEILGPPVGDPPKGPGDELRVNYLGSEYRERGLEPHESPSFVVAGIHVTYRRGVLAEKSYNSDWVKRVDPYDPYPALVEEVKADRLIVLFKDKWLTIDVDVPITEKTEFVEGKKTIRLADLKKGQSLLVTVGPDARTGVKIEVVQPKAKLESTVEMMGLQGTWTVVKFDFDGKAVPQKETAGMKFIVNGDKLSMIEKGEKKDVGVIVLSPGKTPSWFDINVTNGINEGKTSLGIFQREGDRLTLCLRQPGRDRPDSFSSNNVTSLVILERDK